MPRLRSGHHMLWCNVWMCVCANSKFLKMKGWSLEDSVVMKEVNLYIWISYLIQFKKNWSWAEGPALFVRGPCIVIKNVDIPPSVIVPFFAALIVYITMEGSLKFNFNVNTLCIFVFILNNNLSFCF